MQAILGRKITQTQRFLTNGTRLSVTAVEINDNPVVAIKSQDKDGYVAVQLGYGKKKHPKKPQLGHSKKGANLDYAPLFLREIRVAADSILPTVGENITAVTVLVPGDLIDVTGTSKGKGFAGVVKRHHFRGGPRTHGQSDRERAPGSIGQTTTPGRVYKGKRMAGKMGNDTVTLKNLQVVDIEGTTVYVKGLIPGVTDSLVLIKVVGKDKNFSPVVKEVESVAVVEQTPVEEKTEQPEIISEQTDKKKEEVTA